jgi:hypothetical protein
VSALVDLKGFSHAEFRSFRQRFRPIQIPGEPITPQGQLVSSFVHENHIPGNPVSPGDLVSDFVHTLEQVGPPITPQGQIVSDFVHELHNPTTTSIGLGADGFLIT